MMLILAILMSLFQQPVLDPEFTSLSISHITVTDTVTYQAILFNTTQEDIYVHAQLSFYDAKDNYLGEITIEGNNFGAKKRMFSAPANPNLILYKTVKLKVDTVGSPVPL